MNAYHFQGKDYQVSPKQVHEIYIKDAIKKTETLTPVQKQAVCDCIKIYETSKQFL